MFVYETVVVINWQADNPEAPEKRHVDFLDILLAARDVDGQAMSTSEILSEVDTFMFAGIHYCGKSEDVVSHYQHDRVWVDISHCFIC